MRILQICQKPQRRGAEIFAYQLSTTLETQGHSVRIIYLYPHVDGVNLSLRDDDRILHGQESHLFEKGFGVHPQLLRRLLAQIDAFRPDVIQVNGGRTVKYGAFSARCRPKRRWVLIYKNIDNPMYWVRDRLRLVFYQHLVMSQVDGVVGVSESTLQGVRDLYHLNVPSICVLNGRDPAQLQCNIVNEDIRHELGVACDTAVLLFIGRLTQQKRPDRFLRVVHKVHQAYPNIEAWLMGDGPLQTELLNQAQQLGIHKIVRFLGYQEHVGPYLAASDLLLSTSDSEGTPGVVLEAGFLGKPVIATNVGGTAGCIQNGKTGILVDSNDEISLADSVISLLDNPSRLVEMGNTAKDWMMTDFTIDRAAREYASFYGEVIARQAASRARTIFRY
ncbi:MAG: glycosyltransferase family 4 protein [Caldilineaceae bacterium]